MKAVNQCVGRVIRHRGDFAAVVLAGCALCHSRCPEPWAMQVRRWAMSVASVVASNL